MPTHSSSFTEAAGPIIALIDPMEFRRAGLSRLLEDWANTNEISILAFDSAAALAEANVGARCKMAILSIGGAPTNNTDVLLWIDQIRASAPHANLVILSDQKEPRQIVSAFRLGAQGFISTGTEPGVALRALSFILCGGSFFPPHALADLSQLSASSPALENGTDPRAQYRIALPGGLTLRQKEVLACLRLGKSNKQIARELDMQEATVKVHIRQIMRKLGVANRTQAALHAAQLPDRVSSETSGGLDAVSVLPFGSIKSASAIP